MMLLTVLVLSVMMLAGAEARIKPRRTDIRDRGDPQMFHGWVDVQAQGVKNDYCRFVRSGSEYVWLSCALAGTEGQSEYNFNPPNGGTVKFDIGYQRSWYMKDVNGDKRDDYCRCVDGHGNAKSYTACMLADRFGFQCDQYGYAINGCIKHKQMNTPSLHESN